MTSREPASLFFIGWDVGGWNCDKNANSRDAIVILNWKLSIVGKPWRGNLRESINGCPDTCSFINKLFSLCAAERHWNAKVTLAIDTPLGFSVEFTQLVSSLNFVEPVERSSTNRYLFRQTERFLFQHGLSPLSAVKDMIGSQATKGMHVLAKFAPNVKSCGVWDDGGSLTAIEAYPSACKGSESLAALRRSIANWPCDDGDDRTNALTCALIAYFFVKHPEQLLAPSDDVPQSEGWIWVPTDILKEKQP